MSKQRAALSLLLPAIFALFCASWLLSIPSDIQNSLWLGFSASRLGMLGIFALLAAGFGRAAWLAFYAPSTGLHLFLNKMEQNTGVSILLFSLILFFSACFLLIPQEYLKQFQAFHQRLIPIAVWVFYTALVFTINLIAARLQNTSNNEQPPFHALLPGFAFTLAFFLSVWLFIAITGIGIGAPQDFWSRPSVPILWPQTLAALLVGLLVINFAPRQAWMEYTLLAALTILAFLAWSRQSDLPGAFNTPPAPPTYEIFPINDSEIYDTAAHRLRAGHGMDSAVADKPLYIAYLALLHHLDGGSYARFYLLQIAFFTLIPLCGYWLGKEIHSRHLGLAFGLLLIIKEQNAIALTNYLSMSTTKMILSEPLTTLGVLTFTLAFVKWLKNPRLNHPALYLSGGLLGLTSLVRLNSVTILPLAILLIGLALRFEWKKWLPASLAMGLFAFLTISPWILRSALNTGNPISFITAKTEGVISNQRYDPILTTNLPPAASPTTSDKYLLLGQKIAIHYLHNLVSMSIMLPPSPQPYNLFDIIRKPYWKMEWRGELTTLETLTLFSTFAISALGLSASTWRWGAAGLAPLAVALGYNLSTAISLTSGGRYLIPFEWVLIFYYATGWMNLFQRLNFLRPTPGLPSTPSSSDAAETASPTKILILAGKVAALFIFLGATPALIENLSTPRYSQPTNLRQLPWAETPPAFISALEGQPSTRILHGMLLYPRFYFSGEGLVNEPQLPLLTRLPYARLTFSITGPVTSNFILPIQQLPPHFPSVTDAWVVGCQRQGYIEAAAILLPTSSGFQPLITSQTTCP